MTYEQKNSLEFLNIAKDLSKELKIKEEIIYLCIKSEFDFIKEKIESINFENLDPNDLENIDCNFNLKYIGKLSPTKKKMDSFRRMKKYIKDERDKDKEDNTIV